MADFTRYSSDRPTDSGTTVGTNYTLTFDSGQVKGWTSFYSYFPDWMVGMNNYFFSTLLVVVIYIGIIQMKEEIIIMELTIHQH